MRHIPQSPYIRALGEHVHELHPSLHAYFEAIPAGHVGIGEGVFEHAGTPRRWLWPLLRIMQRRGVAFAGWHHDVPFVVHNRTIAGRSISERVFRLPTGEWSMHDAVVVTAGGRLIDELGRPGFVRAAFSLRVIDGALVMTSTAIGLRLGRLRVRMPRVVAPRIRLTEQPGLRAGHQRVDVALTLPLIGRIYEYAGEFTYRIEKERHD